jgi:maltoporin
MYRGDDIYLLDWWPLDNLNTVGAGARFDITERTMVAIHGGLSQPESIFYRQEVDRPSAANGFGANTVNVLDRQKFIGSAKFSHIIPLPDGAGLKGVAYAEAHGLPSGQKETEPGEFEDVPADNGFVIGAQFGGFTGERDTHLNLFVRYSRDLAAYGEFGTPFSLALDRTTTGASEFLVALGGNWEMGPVGVMLGAYIRTFRNANPDLDYGDVDEGILAVRPHVFFGEVGGIAIEASHQVQQRGVLLPPEFSPGQVPGLGAPDGALTGTITRFGIVPFLSPAGRGDYSRPHFRVIYSVSLRSDGARRFYSQDDIFNLRSTEHFFGVGAEWWFNSSYGG